MVRKDKITFTHGTIANIYIVHELNFSNHRYNDYPTLENCLFGAIKLNKNADTDTYKHSGYGIGFSRRWT